MLVEIQHEHGQPFFSAGEVVLLSSLNMIPDHFGLEDVPPDLTSVPRMVVVCQILLATLGSPVQGPPSLGDGVDYLALPIFDAWIEDIHERFDSVEARLMQKFYWAC